MKVHYIKTEKEYDIAFFPETKRFFRVNEKAQRIINDLLAKEDIKIIANREEVSVECIEEYAKKIEECTTRIKNKSNEQSNSNKLKRLVIHLANGCNLRCEYCYANGGTYHSDASMITHETIDRIFDIFYGSFDSIETIQLFGGEPLLNMDAVEYICEKVENICIDREKKTQIGIVTNGTLIDERFAELVQRYHILVTISYDGDIKVNDKLRKDVHGNGMSNLILKNAKMLKEKTGQPNTIEATYTQYHYNNIELNYPKKSFNYDKVFLECGLSKKISSLDNGIETFIYKEFDKGGFEPSGGEGQKIAFVRALYKDSPFVLLDEATAALDPKAEANIYEQFEKLFWDKTIIYISHRMSVTRFCDVIFIFKNGEIIEKGMHKDLMMQNGEYAALYNAQAKYYI